MPNTREWNFTDTDELQQFVDKHDLPLHIVSTFVDHTTNNTQCGVQFTVIQPEKDCSWQIGFGTDNIGNKNIKLTVSF